MCDLTCDVMQLLYSKLRYGKFNARDDSASQNQNKNGNVEMNEIFK